MNLSERIGPQQMLGVAVATAASIVMATATARAADETDKYYLHLHACNIVLKTNQYDTLDLTDLLALQKYIPLLRACDAFYKCVAKRDWRRYTPDTKPKGPIPKRCSWPTRILGPEGSR